MDTSDPEIQFDENGVCIHCRNRDNRVLHDLHLDGEGQVRLKSLVERIKTEGKKKEYDCVIGLSGGVDSAMVAYLARDLGLRPLAVHMDNGWDSELAISNVEKTVKALDLDLHSIVLDWEQFRDLHLSFLKSSVIDSEVTTDHAIKACLYNMAGSLGVRYVLSGSNLATESVSPESWCYDSKDWKHIHGIHNRFGTQKLDSFPHMTLFHWVYYTFVKGIKYIPILNYFDFNKENAKRLLSEEIGWRDYGGKHHESIYTRFFQCYILPRKFGIDKRRNHLSSLILSEQITRSDALVEIEGDPCPPDVLAEDKTFVLKKLGLSEDEFERIMALPPRTFRDYPNNHIWFSKLRVFVNFAKKRATLN